MSAIKKGSAVLGAAVLTSVLALVPATPAMAALQSCSWTLLAGSSTQLTAVNDGGSGRYGDCGLVQARARLWWDSTYNSTVTGSQSSSTSVVRKGGAISMDRKQGRAYPINAWSGWTGYFTYDAFINTSF